MDHLLCVKGRTIGRGKPLVCVPVMEKEKETIVEEFRRLAGCVDMIEWRLDAFSGIGSLNAIRDVLKELEPLVRDTIFVYTFRSRAQGGLLSLAPERVSDIHQVAAESGIVDFVDLEVLETKKPAREVKQLKEAGVHVIASHHDFHQTPERAVIRMLLERIYDSGADVVKLALMPECMQDVLNLLEETNRFHETYPNQALVTMSMGTYGAISRIAGEFFGSCISFGAGKQASAPGQLPMEELETVLSIMHRCVGR